MKQGTLVQVSAFPGWIVLISYTPSVGYRCWVMTPELMILNDGERYRTSTAAMAAGRCLVQYSLGSGMGDGSS